jgi:hypothetical protein
VTDEATNSDADARAAARARYLARRAELEAMPADEWAARRDAELEIVRRTAAALRHDAA